MAAEYIYRVAAWWTSGRTGLAKCESAPNTIHFSEAPEFGGLEGRWTPEQLLLCALAGCFTTTFQDVAHGAKFEYTDLEVEVEGSVHRNRLGMQFLRNYDSSEIDRPFGRGIRGCPGPAAQKPRPCAWSRAPLPFHKPWSRESKPPKCPRKPGWRIRP